MSHISHKKLGQIYPLCCMSMEQTAWKFLSEKLGVIDPGAFSEALVFHTELIFPDYLPELACLEWARHKALAAKFPATEVNAVTINPSLDLLYIHWDLLSCFSKLENMSPAIPRPVNQWVLVWKTSATGELRMQAADAQDLLALKITAKKIAIKEAVKASRAKTGTIEKVLFRAVKKGILLAPASRIQREFGRADTFTLQWHLTNACDFHCKHCYDRSHRTTLPLEKAYAIVDDLREFCRDQRVIGHMCLAGGNPLLYLHFFKLYRYIAECGFSTTILGNPTSREQMQELCEISSPDLYQVSLEGLPEHNDFIRGQGHFARVMAFLGVLRDFSIPSAVMLTLTKANAKQVIPLALKLRNHTQYFCFSRLSQMGEGANLKALDRDEYQAFLNSYLDAAHENPIMQLKDNLFNIILQRREQKFCSGCTGHSGCGAAFNALAILPNGEVHACRKFPSLLGNVVQQTIGEIYHGKQAKRYRKGSKACSGCSLRQVCGGCLAISWGCGLDELIERDPHCFIDQPSQHDIPPV